MSKPIPMRSVLSSLLMTLVLVPAALAFTGCKAPEYPTCKKDKHCNAELGETCVEKTCQNCKVDADCADKGGDGVVMTCQDFLCAAPGEGDGNGASAGVGTIPEGGPCAQMLDCVPGLACMAGVCSYCTGDIDCAGRTCNLDTGRCAPEGQCQMDDECPVDEICDGGMCVFSGSYDDNAEAVCGFASVFFGFDSDKVSEANVAKLQEAASCLTTQERTLTLEAHADSTGTEEYNILLTDKRGNSVKSFLVDLGVAEEKIEVIGKGSLEATGADETSQAKERRVDFFWK